MIFARGQCIYMCFHHLARSPYQWLPLQWNLTVFLPSIKFPWRHNRHPLRKIDLASINSSFLSKGKIEGSIFFRDSFVFPSSQNIHFNAKKSLSLEYSPQWNVYSNRTDAHPSPFNSSASIKSMSLPPFKNHPSTSKHFPQWTQSPLNKRYFHPH